MRWPWYAAGDAAAMMAHAVASTLDGGAPVWVCGNTDEGADGAAAVLKLALGGGGGGGGGGGAGRKDAGRQPEPRVIDAADGAILHCAHAAAAGGGRAGKEGEAGMLASWCSHTSIMLPQCGASLGGAEGVGAAAADGGGGGKRRASGGFTLPPTPATTPTEWATYPGLFAGGGLDVMTSALLAALPSPPPGSTILDACCGSGAIAAALAATAARTPDASLNLHMLDADAVALTAARTNVPSARTFLCAGWPDTATAFAKRGKPKRYVYEISGSPPPSTHPPTYQAAHSGAYSPARLYPPTQVPLTSYRLPLASDL